MVQNVVARATWCFGFVRLGYNGCILECNNSYCFGCRVSSCSLNTLFGEKWICFHYQEMLLLTVPVITGFINIKFTMTVDIIQTYEVPMNAMKVYWYCTSREV